MTNSTTISLLRKEFADQLQVVARGLANRTLIESISGIFMDSSGGKLTLTATDLEMQISSSIDFNGPELQVLLPAQTTSIIKALPGDDLKLEFFDGKVAITAGADGESNIQLPTADPGNFPLFGKNDTEDDSVSVTVTAGEFKKALRQVVFAVSADVNKQNFTCVNLSVVDDALHFAASDTYRLSTTSCPATRVSGSDREILVPAKPLQEFLRFAQKLNDDAIITITGQEKRVVFDAGATQVVARLGVGSFPDVRRLIPDSFSGVLTVDTTTVMRALERAIILTEKNGASVVDLATGEPSLVGVELLVSVASPYGSMKERVTAEYSGDGFTATFNARFLLEWLKICEGDQIQLQHNGLNHPCVALDLASPALKYLVLPIRKHS